MSDSMYTFYKQKFTNLSDDDSESESFASKYTTETELANNEKETQSSSEAIDINANQAIGADNSNKVNFFKSLFNNENWTELIERSFQKVSLIIQKILSLEHQDFESFFGGNLEYDSIKLRAGKKKFLKKDLISAIENFINENDKKNMPDELDEQEYLNGQSFNKYYWFYNYHCLVQLDDNCRKLHIWKCRSLNFATKIVLTSGTMVASTMGCITLMEGINKYVTYILLALKDTAILSLYNSLDFNMKVGFCALFIIPLVAAAYLTANCVGFEKVIYAGKWLVAFMRQLFFANHNNFGMMHDAMRNYANAQIVKMQEEEKNKGKTK